VDMSSHDYPYRAGKFPILEGCLFGTFRVFLSITCERSVNGGAWQLNRWMERGMHFRPGRSAPTIFGWTPGLRYLVEGRVLACGCVVGLYEMWDRSLVEMVDSAADTCDVGHDVNQILVIT
jgi:hypothetical protein